MPTKFPFESVKDGDQWTATSFFQAESICNSFAAWAARRSIDMRASYRRNAEGEAAFTVTFIAGLKKRRRGKPIKRKDR